MRRASLSVVVSILALFEGAAMGGCGGSAAGAPPEVARGLDGVDGRPLALAPSAMRFKPELCQGVDLKPETKKLDVEAFEQFLTARGYRFASVRARADLVYVDVVDGADGTASKEPVRLRVAILKTAHEAGRELHEAILQHGRGAWGVHRGNLAILGPVAPLDQALAFAIRMKLPCFGVMTVADADDDYVVPGAYAEL